MLQVQLKDKWRSLKAQAERTPARRRRAGQQAQHPQLPWTAAEEHGLVRLVAQHGTSNWQVGGQHLQALFGGGGAAHWAAARHQRLGRGSGCVADTLCLWLGLQRRLPSPHSPSRQPACGLYLGKDTARRGRHGFNTAGVLLIKPSCNSSPPHKLQLPSLPRKQLIKDSPEGQAVFHDIRTNVGAVVLCS